MVAGARKALLGAGAALIALAGCGSGGTNLRAAGVERPAPVATTTSAPRHRVAPRPTTTTTRRATPPATGVAGGPVVHDTGTDYVAIFQSLDRYRMWLEREHPDPALVPHVWAPGTDIAARFSRHLGDLQARRVRIIDVGDATTAHVVSVASTPVSRQVSLLVEERFSQIQLVDERGRVLDTAPGATEHLIVLLDSGVDGHWRIAMCDPQLTGQTEVHL